MTTVGEGAEPQRSDITKAGLAALVASSIEWYDPLHLPYGGGIALPAVFFPESSAVAGGACIVQHGRCRLCCLAR